MDKLSPELNRLYGLGGDAREAPAAGIRAVVLAVRLPAAWEQLSAAWRGVQSDLELPAPAIAVSGVDALQLWFSFASPIAPSAGRRFLQALQQRYLPSVAAAQVRVFADAADLPAAPGAEVGPQCWSAFVTHDLAAVFAETPWLDIPPGDDGQATILRALAPIRPGAFEAAMEKLGAAAADPHARPPALPANRPAATDTAGPPSNDPAGFLRRVVDDETAPLALRVEAARILLLR